MKAIPEITPEALAARLRAAEPTYLLDVREPWEYETAKLDGSVLVPLAELPGRVHEIDPPDGALVVTICHHGFRSMSAVAILTDAGHESVASLAGGIDGWSAIVDAGVPRY